MRQRSDELSRNTESDLKRTNSIFVVLVILALPRILRLVFPQIWLEQNYFIYIVHQLASGHIPYKEVMISYPAIPEIIYAFANFFFQNTLWVSRLLNEFTIFILSLFIFIYVKRQFSWTTGLASSLVFSFNSLVFRYDLFAREFMECALIFGSVLLLQKRDHSNIYQIISAGCLLGLAFLCKQTAIISSAALIIFLLMSGLNFKSVAILIISFLIFALSGMGIFYWAYGIDFYLQAILFHIAVGGSGSDVFSQAILIGRCMDMALTLGIMGAITYVFVNRNPHQMKLPFLQLIFITFFYLAISGKFWPANGIEILVWISIPAGWFLICTIQWINKNFQVGFKRADISIAIFGLIIFIVLSVWIFPLKNQNSLYGMFYGFGNLSIDSFNRVVDEVKRRTQPDDICVLNPAVAALADRQDSFFYRENYGLMQTIKNKYKTEGARAAIRIGADKHYLTLIRELAVLWLKPFINLAEQKKVRCVVPDIWFPLSGKDLQKLGFKQVLKSDGMKVWVPGD